MASLSEILNEKISKDGLSKTYVASQLGVSERTIEYYMSGAREPELAKLIKLSILLDFQLNELSEQNVRTDNKGVSKNNKPRNNDGNYIELLESNDKFFKTEYAQMLASLKELIGLSMKQEALLKLNLQHVGVVEALQKGEDVDDIQAQINNQISEIGPYEQRDNDDDK